MQTENSIQKPFFFDDEDKTAGFEFVPPTDAHQQALKQEPIVKNELTQMPSNSNIPDEEGFYAIHSNLMTFYSNTEAVSPSLVLDLSFSRAVLLPPTTEKPYPGFSLSRNGKTLEFYHSKKEVIDEWFECLKQACILTTFHQDYKALKMIGRGGFAKVYLVESLANGKNYAVKAFTKEGIILANKSNAKPSMLNEISIMKAVDHENIIKLYETHETERSIYLVLELVQGKSLQEILKKNLLKQYTEVKVKEMIRSILDALAYLTSKGIMHRDLKPDNILVDENSKIKIIDFGLATFIDVPEYIFKKCGTPGYIAPEVFKFDQKNPQTKYDHRCDVFSAGCIFFYMLFGVPLFEGPAVSQILNLNKKFNPEFTAILTISREIKNPESKLSKEALGLLQRLLEYNYQIRVSASQALTHPFFNPGFSQMVQNNGLLDSPQYSEKDITSPLHSGSPSFDPKSKFMRHNSLKNSVAHSSQNKDRFVQKDSLYLDVGKPELTGQVNTIAMGSNNSLINQKLSNNNIGANSNSGSASTFAPAKLSPTKKSTSFKTPGVATPNKSFLKAVIFKTMQKQNYEHPNEEAKEDDCTSPHKEKSNSAGIPFGNSPFSPDGHKGSPFSESEES